VTPLPRPALLVDAVPGNRAFGTAVVNGDGTITVTVSGTWTWDSHNTDCNIDRYAAGWQVDWNDPNDPGFHVTTLGADSIDVGSTLAVNGNTVDNAVKFNAGPTPPRCGTFVNGHPQGTWGPISHTYAAGTDPTTISPCALMYDIHGDSTGPSNPDKDLVAGGDNPAHNDDNSAEKNSQHPQGNVCAAITIAPDVSVVKTAPAQVTLGQNITYGITAANTGIVPATDVTVTDTLPTNATFVSATPTVGTCDAPAGGQLVCHLGTLAVGASASISVTVTPTVTATVSNTAVVTPDDTTPSDNTSTVQTGVIAPAPAAVVVTPVVVQPAFTG